jgi:hypothetical protein
MTNIVRSYNYMATQKCLPHRYFLKLGPACLLANARIWSRNAPLRISFCPKYQRRDVEETVPGSRPARFNSRGGDGHIGNDCAVLVSYGSLDVSTSCGLCNQRLRRKYAEDEGQRADPKLGSSKAEIVGVYALGSRVDVFCRHGL